MRVAASGPAGTGLNYGERERADGRPVEAPRAQLPAVVRPREECKPETRAARPVAALVAQLVAGMHDAPALRARRRTDPATGTEAYRTVAAFGPPAAPRFGRRI